MNTRLAQGTDRLLVLWNNSRASRFRVSHFHGHYITSDKKADPEITARPDSVRFALPSFPLFNRYHSSISFNALQPMRPAVWASLDIVYQDQQVVEP